MCGDARELTKKLYWSCVTGMGLDEREAAVKALEEGERLAEDGKYAEAYKALIRLAKARRKSVFSEQAASALRGIAKLGAERLAEAKEQAETDADGAIEALEKMQGDFEGFRVARSAGTLLAKLKGGEATEPVETEPVTVKEPPPKPKPPRPKPPKPATGQAERWLRMARNYLANGKTAPAKRYLELILKRFPDSAEVMRGAVEVSVDEDHLQVSSRGGEVLRQVAESTPP